MTVHLCSPLWAKLIIANTIGMKSSCIPRSDALNETKEKLYAPKLNTPAINSRITKGLLPLIILPILEKIVVLIDKKKMVVNNQRQTECSEALPI